MSADTKAALEAALQAHVTSEWEERYPGSQAVASAYVLEVAVVDLSESVNAPMSHYLRVAPDMQDYHVSRGLLSTATDDLRAQ